MIIGPNGAGKTTIINAISRAVPCEGEIRVCGQEITSLGAKDLARRIGVLSQNHYIGYGFKVEEVVRLGAYSLRPGFLGKESPGQSDSIVNVEGRIDEALRRTGLTEYRDRSVTTLSGGELQRTFLAQLFVQDPQIMLLDEPANHLDLIYQKQVFGLVKEWLEEKEAAVVSVVHDLSLAGIYGTNALLMNQGKAVAQGDISEVMTPEHLNQVYGMDVAEWMRNLYEQWQR